MTIRLIAIAVLLNILSCSVSPETEPETLQFDLNDAVTQQILNFQNKRSTKQLLTYVAHQNPNYRLAATQAFASVQDSVAIKDLKVRLEKDEYPEIREAAAFALGQIGTIEASEALIKAFKTDTNSLVQAAILEAVGKSASKKYLDYLGKAPPYPVSDSSLWEGQAWGIYRFALRNIVSPAGTGKMVEILLNKELAPKARFAAANYFFRAKDLKLNNYENLLIKAAKEEQDFFVKLFLVVGLGKIKTPAIRQTLEQLYKTASDHRMKCNILRGLSEFEYDSIKPLVFSALSDKNLQVRNSSARLLHRIGIKKDAPAYFDAAKKANHWSTKALLNEAGLHHLSYRKSSTKAKITKKLKAAYSTSENVYEKGQLLKVMAEFGWNYDFIGNETTKTDANKVIISSGTEALIKIFKDDQFKRVFGPINYRKVRFRMAKLFQTIIDQGDVAAIALLSDFFKDKSMNFAQYYDDYRFLLDARDKLTLPRDIETYNVLQEAIAVFLGKEAVKATAQFESSSPKWEILTTVQDSVGAIIKTTKGTFTIQLFPKKAPASVDNFIQLVNTNFYSEKAFHRVVPNFVIQTGCPRGDGWGGVKNTIKSEFSSLSYHDEGWVGMASAGKDTEGSQWFVTHSPTPHLDGRYTIFGKVTQGMDVIQKIEVGDKIKSISIQ